MGFPKISTLTPIWSRPTVCEAAAIRQGLNEIPMRQVSERVIFSHPEWKDEVQKGFDLVKNAINSHGYKVAFEEISDSANEIKSLKLFFHEDPHNFIQQLGLTKVFKNSKRGVSQMGSYQLEFSADELAKLRYVDEIINLFDEPSFDNLSHVQIAGLNLLIKLIRAKGEKSNINIGTLTLHKSDEGPNPNLGGQESMLIKFNSAPNDQSAEVRFDALCKLMGNLIFSIPMCTSEVMMLEKAEDCVALIRVDVDLLGNIGSFKLDRPSQYARRFLPAENVFI